MNERSDGGAELESIPRIGLGTWQLTNPQQTIRAVRTALSMGYRHIDTAQIYHNESYVGRALAASGVSREDVFLATKVAHSDCTHERVISSVEDSLRRLRVDYVDLLYVHWPTGNYHAPETLRAFQHLIRQGKVRYGGVSNFTRDQLEDAQRHFRPGLWAHQFELHPFLQQPAMVGYCRRHDLRVIAYSPFRHGTLFGEETLQSIASRHGATPAQVVLSWLIEALDVYPIPKASTEDHLRENFRARSLSLGTEDHERLRELDRGDRFLDPPFAPW